MITTRAQRKLLHAWTLLVIVEQHLIQMCRISGPTEYMSYILAGIRSRSLYHTVVYQGIFKGFWPPFRFPIVGNPLRYTFRRVCGSFSSVCTEVYALNLFYGNPSFTEAEANCTNITRGRNRSRAQAIVFWVKACLLFKKSLCSPLGGI